MNHGVLGGALTAFGFPLILVVAAFAGDYLSKRKSRDTHR